MDIQNVKVKLSQIFQYLNAYQRLKNPVRQNVTEHEWHLWLDALPVHETVVWNRPVIGDGMNNEAVEEEEDFIVKIRRPNSVSCPDPPLRIGGWLKEGWRLPENPVEPTDPEGLSKHLPLVEEFKTWLAAREIWAGQQLKARKILEVYDRFYNLYALMKREAERVELVWADGILKARTDKNETTMYPLVSQRVELVFDSEIPEFKLVQSDQKPEFNSDLLRQLSNINSDVIGECRVEFEARIGYLFENDAKVNAFLNSISAKLGAAGRFTVDAAEFNRINEVVVILKRPVLLLRNRTIGFESFMDRLTADIGQLQAVPDALAALLGFETRDPGMEVPDERIVLVK